MHSFHAFGSYAQAIPRSWKHKLCCMTPFQCNREVFVETTELNWTLHRLLKHRKKANVLPVVWKTAYDYIPRGKLWEVLQDYNSHIPSYCRLWNPFTGCVKTAPGFMSTFLTDLKAREESIIHTWTGNTNWFCYQSNFKRISPIHICYGKQLLTLWKLL